MSFSPFQTFADFWTRFFDLDPTHGFGAAFNFFVYDFPKVTFLIASISFVMGILRASLPLATMRDWLAHSRFRVLGYPAAALFGAVTPFCSCSSVPLFIGFVESGIPLGITFTFLITSPLINEIVVALFIGSFGVEITILYVVAGLAIGIFGGLVIQAFHVERWLTPFALGIRSAGASSSPTQGASPKPVSASAACCSNPSAPSSCCADPASPAAKSPATTCCGNKNASSPEPTWRARLRFGAAESRAITLQVLPYLAIALVLGAAIHGYVPENFFARYFSGADWWGVPVATAIGLPLYASANGTVPILETLVAKGVPFGTAMAFILSAVGVSLPELIILKRVMTIRLLALFTAVVSTGIIIVGYLFNALHYVPGS